MKTLISYITVAFILCFSINRIQAQEGYTYSLVDNGSFNYTIVAMPNVSSSNFATSVQSYGFTITLPDGVTASITSSLGNSANATFFDGNNVAQPTIDGYLITETLGSPVSLPAPVNGTASAMVTIQLNQSPTSGTIVILANNSGLATTVTPLKSFMSADMVDDGMAVFTNVVDPNASGVSGTSSFDFSTLSVSNQELLELSIYPNPTEGLVNIIGVSDLEIVEVYNVSGQLVKSFRSNLETIDLTNLNAGLYLVKLQSKSKSKSKTVKLIIE